jgi:hypothetical protein
MVVTTGIDLLALPVSGETLEWCSFHWIPHFKEFSAGVTMNCEFIFLGTSMEHFLLQHLLVWTCHYAMSCHLLMYKWKTMVKDVGNQGDWLDNLFDVFAGLLLVCSNWKAMARGVWNQDDWSDQWSKHKHGEGAKVMYVVACRFYCSLTGCCWIRHISPAAKQLQQSQFFQWHNPSMQIIMEEEAGHEKSMQDFPWVNCTIIP